MVSLGIVAILAVVLFAATNAAIVSAKRGACLAHMRTIATAVISYTGEHDQFYPMNENPAWDVPLAPYIGDGSQSANPVLECPADPRPLIGSGGYARSYSFNGGLPASTLQVNEPAQTILLAEWYSGGTTGPGGAASNFQYGPRFDIVTYGAEAVPAAPGSRGYHGPTSNFVFADGHAESLDPTTISADPYIWAVASQ